jgi:hypothetical protein
VFVIDTRIKRRALRNWLVLQSESHGSDLISVTYYEIGGDVRTSETPSAIRALSIKTTISESSPKIISEVKGTVPAPFSVAMPYSVGVGRGNPRTWLGANVILWGAKKIYERRPEYADYDKLD